MTEQLLGGGEVQPELGLPGLVPGLELLLLVLLVLETGWWGVRFHNLSRGLGEGGRERPACPMQFAPHGVRRLRRKLSHFLVTQVFIGD